MDADTAAREGQVTFQGQRLEKAIGALHEDIARLEERLAPILSSPSTGKEVGEPDEVLVAHAEFLAKMVRQVLAAGEWIRLLRERIEL